MAYDDMTCPCGDAKMRETMLCLACEKHFEAHPEMTVFRDDVRYTVNSRRSAAIVILSLARRRKKAPRGQRYEIWCDDEDGKPMQMGWSNNPAGMKQAVEKHPCWSNHRAVDRLAADAADAPVSDGGRTAL